MEKSDTKDFIQGTEQRMGLTASQIRQDFNCFGGFGQQGYGYHERPVQRDQKDPGLHKKYNVIIVGQGMWTSLVQLLRVCQGGL